MAKFYGTVGFATTEETVPGVWTEKIEERNYYGDVIRNKSLWGPGDGLNDNPNLNNQFSIMSDPYALGNFPQMRYVSWMGTKWKVKDVEVQRPRLIISIGGVYNE